MSTPFNDALNVFKGYLTPIGAGGSAVNLSAFNKAYFSGTVTKRYAVKDGFARFFDQAWEVPITDLDGSVSTGVIYIIPKDEINREINENYNSMKWYRDISVDVVVVFFDEGTRSEYEDLIFAVFKVALKDPTLTNNILYAKLNSISRERPPATGLIIVTLNFSFEMKNNVY